MGVRITMWMIVVAVVLPLIALGAVGCKKKGPKVDATGTGVSGPGGTGEGGLTGRGTQVSEAQNRLQTIYFDYDAFDLRSDAQETLKANAKVIEQYPDVRIQIQGHCDERGSEEYNLALGDKRARSARDYLVNLGISGERLTTISFGEERPVDPGQTEEAYGKNRRDEFVAE
jgi:peptidoglycan-associated lipoprotein